MSSKDTDTGRIMGNTQTASAEAYCPTCEQSYASDVGACPDDGTKLVQFAPDSDDLIGTVLDDRFEIRSRLGQGGMGTVYRAWQSSVGREVAVKVIDRRLSRHRPLAKRFLREARLSSRLSQANTVVCHDFGQTSDGVLYIVMELIAGRTLRQELLDRGALPAERVTRIAVQLCDALSAAHRLGIIHRDLKPANIMILDEPAGRDVVKVLDFGLAKSLAGDDTTTTITDSNAVMGTPKYMSPEQISGEAEVDARSDLYSLGCIMYEMIAGRAPFLGSNTNLLLARHMADEPPALDEAVAGNLAPLVHRLLAKAGEDRPQSAVAVHDALVSGRGHAPTTETRRIRKPNEPNAEANVPTASGMLRKSASAPAEATEPERTRSWAAPILGLALVAAMAALLIAKPWQGASDGDGATDVAAASNEPTASETDTPPTGAPAATPTAPAADAAPPATDPDPRTVELVLRATPRATVTVGGKAAGKTPATVELPVGDDEVAIVFRRAGYVTERRTFRPTDDDAIEVRLARKRTKKQPDRDRPPKVDPPKADPDEPPPIDFKR